jgi:hypothetical protein
MLQTVSFKLRYVHVYKTFHHTHLDLQQSFFECMLITKLFTYIAIINFPLIADESD